MWQREHRGALWLTIASFPSDLFLHYKKKSFWVYLTHLLSLLLFLLITCVRQPVQLAARLGLENGRLPRGR